MSLSSLPQLPEHEREQLAPPPAPDGEHDYLYGYILHSGPRDPNSKLVDDLKWAMVSSRSLANLGMCAMQKETLMVYFAAWSNRDRIVVGVESGTDKIPYGPHIEKIRQELGTVEGKPCWVPVDNTFFHRTNKVDRLIETVQERISRRAANAPSLAKQDVTETYFKRLEAINPRRATPTFTNCA
ncbi:hypothetical protein MKEN_00659300 [Mycena kentingensis (nom. inval.)]|nr:hypothetical protein MKEN_00659300 [Mycena kentingensis (nom. inval.)]